MKEFAIVKDSVVKYEGEWWKVVEEKGPYLRIEFIHKRASMCGILPVIQKTIPRPKVEDCRVSINGNFDYLLVRADKRVDPRRFAFYKESNFVAAGKKVSVAKKCVSVQDALKAIEVGEHLFTDVKKPVGLSKGRLEAHNRALCLQKRLESIELYYRNPNKCKHCGGVILVKPNSKVSLTRKMTFCSEACRAPYRKQNFEPEASVPEYSI